MVKVYSKTDFELVMDANWLSDENVEESSNAFISITGHIDQENHWFEGNHLNVLNLRFDDINQDELKIPIIGEGESIAKGISKEQARDIVDFVLDNKDKDFHVHCHAGISRSGAVGSFIAQILHHDTREFFAQHPHIHPQQRVLRMLKEEARNRGLL